MRTIQLLIFALMLLGSSAFAQHRGGHERVVVRSTYRPASITVFHPVWHPHYDYHRRWVYFPRYRMYWDNWRNHYVYMNNGVWVSDPVAPGFVVNVDLSKADRRELEERYDDNDEVYVHYR